MEGRKIGNGLRPFIIAEISGNHGGSITKALTLIGIAKKAGADAVKFQAYLPDTITIDCNRPEFQITKGPWAGQTLYSLYKQAHTPFGWLPELFEEARHVAILPFASVFDRLSVDMLDSMGCKLYKIASFELVDTPLIRYTASTGKPLILSTGMASKEEIDRADDAIPLDIPRAFLHCVSGYPTPIGEANLGRICQLEKEYCVPVGLSDHTLGSTAAVAATALGTAIIEKHITLSRADGGPDAEFSLEPIEFANLVSSVHGAWSSLQPSAASSEQTSLPFRRSLFVVEDVREGEVASQRNVRSIRPGNGISPHFLPLVLGNRFRRSMERGTPLTLADVGL